MSESDQRFHELEQRYLILKKDYDLSAIERDSAIGKASVLKSLLDDANTKTLSYEKDHNDIRLELMMKENVIKELNQTDISQREKIHRMSEECDNLKDERKQQRDDISGLQKKLRELQSDLSTAENAHFPVQFELTKTTRERDSLTQQVQILEHELSTKSTEFSNQRQQMGAKTNLLEAELTTEKADNASKTQQIIALQSRIATQDQKVDAYMAKIADRATQ